MDFHGGARSTIQQVVVVNEGKSAALEALQSLIADLQPAASGPMTAEKQQTETDAC